MTNQSRVHARLGHPNVAPKGREREVSAGNGFNSYGDTLDAIASRDSGLRRPVEVAPRLVKPIDCPCCRRPVEAPTLEIVVDHFRITPLEASILGAVWKGRGHPVQTERIFDAMYADDPDGGPSPQRMYRAFKVALCHLRQRLNHSGISIENVGYRRGYRLIIKEKN